MEYHTTHPLLAYPMYREDMPSTARDLIDLLGWPAARALLIAYAGANLMIQLGKCNNSAGAARYEHLVEIMGAESADKLLQVYGGDILNMPTCFRAIARARQRLIQARWAAGAGRKELCAEFGVTAVWLVHVLKRSLTPTGDPLE